ncbi:MAG TPA: class I SAM-dependent methyltransferase, partial [Pseudobdellovibrionaceae bacterium]|nr:class I SAM-dependent methyltransferase [Pseudobdellovibrionaceae bacterium]
MNIFKKQILALFFTLLSASLAWGSIRKLGQCARALGSMFVRSGSHDPEIRVKRGEKTIDYLRTNRNVNLIKLMIGSDRVDLTKIAGKRILDAGAGSGQFTFDLASHKVNVTGLDLVLTEQQLQRPDLFVQADMRFSPFANSTFDGIYSIWSVFAYELQNQNLIDGVIREFYRILKPGGFARIFPVGRAYLRVARGDRPKYAEHMTIAPKKPLIYRRGRLYLDFDRNNKIKVPNISYDFFIEYQIDGKTLSTIGSFLDHGFDVHVDLFSEDPNESQRGVIIDAVKRF